MELLLEEVRRLAADCRLCPKQCRVNRLKGEIGKCRLPYGPIYSSATKHFGEEPPISGIRGSGTVFLTGCNLRCRFCQNYPISQLQHGNPTTPQVLAEQMLYLQERGAHNINLVTPTPQAAAVFESLYYAHRWGLNIPIVYNCGGYESLDMLRLWEGIVDIYMPDAKYGDDRVAEELSNAPEYVRHNRAALKEMHRQVGDLEIDEQGIGRRGLLVRHLVLPDGLAGTEAVLKFIAEELSPNTYISLMSQYFPAWHACGHPVLGRRLTAEEYRRAVKLLEKYGLNNGWVQPYVGGG